MSIREYLVSMDAVMNRSMSTWGAPKPTTPYKSMHDFVLDRGVEAVSSPLTDGERDVVHAAMRGLKVEMKQCFVNAQQLVMADGTGTLVYNEGWACGGFVTTHHGWATINGKVIDVTWTVDGNPVLGAFPDGWAYLGVRFDRDAIPRRPASIIDDPTHGWPVLRWSRTGVHPAA